MENFHRIFFQNKINATFQSELIKSALTLTHKVGIRVWAITCDGACTNFSSMKMLGCEFGNSYESIKNWFNHPISNALVYFIPDPCHMLKLARNTLRNHKVLLSNKGVVAWEYIDRLYNLQNDLTLKFTNTLSKNHIQWQQNSMKEKFATQTLSSSVADALQYLNSIDYDNFKNVGPTILFIRTIDRIFDFLNVRNPFAKGYKTPIFPSNIDKLETIIIPLIRYLYNLCIKVGNQIDNSIFLHVNKNKTFVITDFQLL